MKKLLTILMVLFAFLFMVGCSENDDNPTGDDTDAQPPEMAEVADVEFVFPTDVTAYNVTQIDFEGTQEDAISLDQFIDLDGKEYMDEETYLYQIFSTDEDGNFSARNKNYDDLNWQDFIAGYYLPNVDEGKSYFPAFVENQINAYNVKYAHYIRLYRKIDVIMDGETTYFEVNSLTNEPISYTHSDELVETDGVTMTQFISEYVTENPENYEYVFMATDDYTVDPYPWSSMQTAYWVPEKDRVVFIDAEGNEIDTNFKHLYSIELSEIATY